MQHCHLQHESSHKCKNRRTQHRPPQDTPRLRKRSLFVALLFFGTQNKTTPRAPYRCRKEQAAKGDVESSRRRHGEKIHDQAGQVRNHGEQINRAKRKRRSEANPQDAEKRAAHAKGAAAKGKPGQHSVKRQHAGKLHEHAQDDEPQRTRDARCYNARHGDKTAPCPLRVGHLDLQNSTRIRWRICADESLSFESTQMHRPHNPLNGRMVSTEPSAPSGNTVAHLAESVP